MGRKVFDNGSRGGEEQPPEPQSDRGEKFCLSGLIKSSCNRYVIEANNFTY